MGSARKGSFGWPGTVTRRAERPADLYGNIWKKLKKSGKDLEIWKNMENFGKIWERSGKT